jgi:putative SOS response-associated peptidase YedK
MCFTVQVQSDGQVLQRFFRRKKMADIPQNQIFGQVSGFDHPSLAVVLMDDPAAIHYHRWGLIPAWASMEQAPILAQQTLNARCETIFEKPSFRDSIFTQRCWVLVDGFYEWQLVGKQKVKHLITLRQPEPMVFGGIYAHWHAPGQAPIRSFSIVTTPANPLMEVIHNQKKRMPLILSPEGREAWLDPGCSVAEIRDLMKPFEQNEMTAQAFGATQLGLFG